MEREQDAGLRLCLGIVDNDVFALRAVRAMIERHAPDILVAWTTTSGREAVHLCLDPGERPMDVLLLDMDMPDMSGDQASALIRARTDGIGILAMTSFSLSRFSALAAQAGAQGIVHKEDDPRPLIANLRRVARGLPIDAGAGTRFETAARAHERLASALSAAPELSAREIQVLRFCANGRTDAAIADELTLSEFTVKTHMRRIMRKLNAHNRAEAVARCMLRKII